METVVGWAQRPPPPLPPPPDWPPRRRGWFVTWLGVLVAWPAALTIAANSVGPDGHLSTAQGALVLGLLVLAALGTVAYGAWLAATWQRAQLRRAPLYGAAALTGALFLALLALPQPAGTEDANVFAGTIGIAFGAVAEALGLAALLWVGAGIIGKRNRLTSDRQWPAG
jgi:hypothetical protein